MLNHVLQEYTTSYTNRNSSHNPSLHFGQYWILRCHVEGRNTHVTRCSGGKDKLFLTGHSTCFQLKYPKFVSLSSK